MKVHAAFVQTIVAMLALSVTACGAGEGDSKDNLGIGFIIGGASPADVGLPTYPGAKPFRESDEDSSSSADIDIKTPLFGLKVVAMKLETGDEPEKVAAFYKRALSQYGRVLECVDGERAATKTRRDANDSEELTCDPDEPEEHEVVYKAGSESNQRIVAIKPHQGGSRFSLVHVDTRDESSK
jgi:hypothetical protein